MQFNTENLDISTFMASGKSLATLTEEADAIRHSFAAGSWYLGIFLGLVFGFTLLNQVIYRRREGYTPHKGDCVSCGRCFDYCPVQKHAENTNHE
jgi:ferredoxin